MINRIKGKEKRICGEIDEAFQQIRDAVKRGRLELIEKVKTSSVAQSTQLEIQKEGLERISHDLEVSLKVWRVAVNDYNSLEMLAIKGSVYSASKRGLEESIFILCVVILSRLLLIQQK